MTFDGRLLYKARHSLDEIRQKNEAELSRRRENAYKRNPELQRIESEIKNTMLQMINSVFTGKDISDIKSRNLTLQSALKHELLVSGFPEDYLDMHYNCPKCSDTGYIKGEMCSCLIEQYKKEQAKELSSLLHIGEETFDSFDLDYYSDAPLPGTGISPRTNMEFVRDTCWTYSNKFGASSKNLFLTGGTGLGKTFLSTCIAKVVSEKGFSVVYDRANTVFSKFEEEKFQKYEDVSQAKSDINRYLSCDLLILDDLGTEMTTSFTVSALYDLVNTRLVSGKKTIISSNLEPSELSKRYSPQIASRILGEYEILKFTGSDIRLLKKKNIRK